MTQLYWNTVNGLLRNVLETTMLSPEFSSFRLVGGTALSLQLGHRISVDIDLFTDALYGTIDLTAFEIFFRNKYAYVRRGKGFSNIGTTYYVGHSETQWVKVDIFYVDQFVFPMIEIDNIRMASKEEICAMKLEVVGRVGRKKDFWDLHELSDHFDPQRMIGFYKERYPWGHESEEILAKLKDFTLADDELDPECLHGKYWEVIKLDLLNWLKSHRN